jgi:hypothetical protein
MDEPSVQVLQETRSPIAATATPGQRVAYAYDRAGTAALCMCAEPVAGWRDVAVRARTTQRAWAIARARWRAGRSAACGTGLLVGDNLNTHPKGAFYDALAPERARALVRRRECCSTPKPGRGLNIAEHALRALTRPCVAERRFGEVASLREETTAWSNEVNATQRGVDWQMTIDDARTKLKSVYPTIKL